MQTPSNSAGSPEPAFSQTFIVHSTDDQPMFLLSADQGCFAACLQCGHSRCLASEESGLTAVQRLCTYIYSHMTDSKTKGSKEHVRSTVPSRDAVRAQLIPFLDGQLVPRKCRSIILDKEYVESFERLIRDREQNRIEVCAECLCERSGKPCCAASSIKDVAAYTRPFCSPLLVVDGIDELSSLNQKRRALPLNRSSSSSLSPPTDRTSPRPFSPLQSFNDGENVKRQRLPSFYTDITKKLFRQLRFDGDNNIAQQEQLLHVPLTALIRLFELFLENSDREIFDGAIPNFANVLLKLQDASFQPFDLSREAFQLLTLVLLVLQSNQAASEDVEKTVLNSLNSVAQMQDLLISAVDTIIIGMSTVALSSLDPFAMQDWEDDGISVLAHCLESLSVIVCFMSERSSEDSLLPARENGFKKFLSVTKKCFHTFKSKNYLLTRKTCTVLANFSSMATLSQRRMLYEAFGFEIVHLCIFCCTEATPLSQHMEREKDLIRSVVEASCTFVHNLCMDDMATVTKLLNNPGSWNVMLRLLNVFSESKSATIVALTVLGDLAQCLDSSDRKMLSLTSVVDEVRSTLVSYPREGFPVMAALRVLLQISMEEDGQREFLRREESLNPTGVFSLQNIFVIWAEASISQGGAIIIELSLEILANFLKFHLNQVHSRLKTLNYLRSCIQDVISAKYPQHPKLVFAGKRVLLYLSYFDK